MSILLQKILIIIVLNSILSCSDEMDANKNKNPNIIIFFTDDQGYGDLGCYGAINFKTPNIDNLASSGIRFTDFYVPASVCTPSRAALLTGKYPIRVGLHKKVIFPYSKNGLSPKEVTLAEMLKGVGYHTGIIGKWHLGHLPEYMPTRQGFDYYYGVPYSNDMDSHLYTDPVYQSTPLPVYLNESVVQVGPNQDSLTHMWTDAAINFIRENNSRPFFLYLAHNMPHTPWHASKNFQGSSNYSLYGDAIQELDWSMGEIIKILRENGIIDNTIIIFTSDNGAMEHHDNGGSNGPLRGWKGTTWEGGFRVPGIISWPSVIPEGKTCSQAISTLDIFPTVASITGANYPPQIELDGRDISNLLIHPERENASEFKLLYYSTQGKLEALRMGKWKLHVSKINGWNSDSAAFSPKLYNLEEDIGEQINLINQYPEIYKKMKDELNRIDESFGGNSQN